MKEQERDYQDISVREFMLAARQSIPPTPTIPSLEVRKLRAALILEEALETIVHGLGICVGLYDHFTGGPVYLGPEQAKTAYYSGHLDFNPNLEEIADGCADLKVVTVGTEIACGINGKPVFEEVHRSNMSKFIDGTFRADGKYMKGPSYTKPLIGPILEAQGK